LIGGFEKEIIIVNDYSTDDGGCVVIGQTNSYGNGNYDFLVKKVDKNGMIDYILNGRDVISDGVPMIFPNPLRGNGKIKMKPGIPLMNYRLNLISIYGSTVHSMIIYPPAYNFNTGNLSPGIYFYQIRSETNPAIKYKGKLIIY